MRASYGGDFDISLLAVNALQKVQLVTWLPDLIPFFASFWEDSNWNPQSLDEWFDWLTVFTIHTK